MDLCSFEELSEMAEAGKLVAEKTVTITKEMHETFAELVNCATPFHNCEEHAKTHGFDTTISYGFLYAVLSAEVVAALVGQFGLVYKWELQMHKPLYVGDTLKIGGGCLERARAFVNSI